MNKLSSLMWSLVAFLILLPGSANADLGPKPRVDIDLVYNQQKISDSRFSAKMLECDEIARPKEQSENAQDSVSQLSISSYDASSKCYWQPALLAWGGECSDSKCNFGYFPPSEFKLAVYLPSLDKTFITERIGRENFSSRYKVELFTDGTAKITETTPLWTSFRLPAFVRALLITIFFELLVTWIFLTARKFPRNKILLYVLLANTISLPVVWFIFPLVNLSEIAVMVIFEFFAVIFETYFIHHFCKSILSFKQTFLLSLINNFVSLFVGGYVFMLVMFFV